MYSIYWIIFGCTNLEWIKISFSNVSKQPFCKPNEISITFIATIYYVYLLRAKYTLENEPKPISDD